MPKVRIYVRSVRTDRPHFSVDVQGWYAAHGGMMAAPRGLLTKETVALEKRCAEALEVVRRFCAEFGVDCEVLDVEKWRFALRARLDGVTEVPTVVIGDRRFPGVPSRDGLEKAWSAEGEKN